MTSLLDVVRSNNVRILNVMVALPGYVCQSDLNKALLCAVLEEHTECVQCLLQAKADPEVSDSAGNVALHLAVKAGSANLVALLIRSGTDINLKGSGQSTPLHNAARFNRDECMELLIDAGARVDVTDALGDTPIIVASKVGNHAALKMLTKARAALNIGNNEGMSALHYSCATARGFDILLASGADPNIIDKHGNTPAMLAAAEGFSNVIRSLIKANCDVNILNTSLYRTVLHLVAMKGHADTIADLVSAGADINIYDREFKTPLWYAIQNCRFDAIKLLFRANSHVDTFHCKPWAPEDACPTRLALQKGLVNVVKLFLLTGYDSEHMRQCLKDPVTQKALRECEGQSEEALQHWLDFATGPLTLKQICRKWLRHHMGRLLFHDLNCLHLPQALNDYLTLKELDDHTL